MALRSSTLVLLLACGLVACASAPVPGDAPATASAASPQQQIPGLRAPREYLLTSAQPAPGDWSTLAEQGVVAVVNLRPDEEQEGRDERAEVTGAGMAYHQIPISGAGDLTKENASLLWALAGNPEGPVLVHCGSANRAGALLALGAAYEGGMSPVDALAFGKSAGLTSPAMEQEVRKRLGLPSAEAGKQP